MSDALPLTVECTPRLRPTTEYAALLEAFNEGGFEVHDRAPLEQRDAGFVAAVVALYVGHKVADEALDRLTTTVLDWGERQLHPFMRRRNVSTKVTVPIYGPEGELFREVELTESQSSSRGTSDPQSP